MLVDGSYRSHRQLTRRHHENSYERPSLDVHSSVSLARDQYNVRYQTRLILCRYRNGSVDTARISCTEKRQTQGRNLTLSLRQSVHE